MMELLFKFQFLIYIFLIFEKYNQICLRFTVKQLIKFIYLNFIVA